MNLQSYIKTYSPEKTWAILDVDIYHQLVDAIQIVDSDRIITIGIQDPQNIARALIALEGGDRIEEFNAYLDTEVLKNSDPFNEFGIDWSNNRYEQVTVPRIYVEQWLINKKKEGK